MLMSRSEEVWSFFFCLRLFRCTPCGRFERCMRNNKMKSLWMKFQLNAFVSAPSFTHTHTLMNTIRWHMWTAHVLGPPWAAASSECAYGMFMLESWRMQHTTRNMFPLQFAVFSHFSQYFLVFLLIEFSLACIEHYLFYFHCNFRLISKRETKAFAQRVVAPICMVLLFSSLFSSPRFLLHIFHCIPRLIDNN